MSDNRRILFIKNGTIYLINTQSRRVTEVLSAAPHHIAAFTLARDDRVIYYSVAASETDVWLASLD